MTRPQSPKMFLVFAVGEFDLADDDASLNLGRPAGEDESGSSADEEKPKMKVSAGLKAAIKRLHENTGQPQTCPCTCNLWRSS